MPGGPRFGGMLDRCFGKPRPAGPMDFLRFPGSTHQLSPGKVFHHDLQGFLHESQVGLNSPISSIHQQCRIQSEMKV